MTQNTAESLEQRIKLRPVTDEDEDFLRELYFSVRDDLKGIFPDEDQVRQLLEIQYKAQAQAYAVQFPGASHDIVMLDGNVVGRVMIDRQPSAFYCVDIALLPEVRSRGIGSVVLKRFVDECSRLGIPFTLRVAKTNRAQRLYERLGFRIEVDEGMHLYMKRESEG